jgi:4-hydroxybenzoate polyprenyltransferase/phosphoserine phosphatase
VIESADSKPLCVNCDGTLVRTNTLMEGVLQLAKNSLADLARAPRWLLGGLGYFKEQVALHSDVDVKYLPYNSELLALLEKAHGAGRRLVLVASGHQSVAQAIADHLGLFAEVHGSTRAASLTVAAKQKWLCERFGSGQYVYAGSHRRDLAIWRTAHAAIVVDASARTRRLVESVCEVEQLVPGNSRKLSDFLRSLRAYQWLKNLLVLVPVVAAHRLGDAHVLLLGLLATSCFCLYASSAYILNDLLDLRSDRRHPRKRSRPFASGAIPVSAGAVATVLLVIGAAIAAIALPPLCQLTLVAYFVLTIGYSTTLKNRAVVDVLVLAGLYTLRLVAGAAATQIRPSFWLLAFSMFFFLGLALVKRYAEVVLMLKQGRQDLHGRGYVADDLPLLSNLGTSSGLVAVLILALYVNSSEVTLLYTRPALLWIVLPLLLYWTCRVWLKAHRGQMHDDPLIFAATDRPSLVVAVAVAVAVFGATRL